MTYPSFRPVLYLKQGCPFCLKVRLYALEAGMLDTIELREFVPGSSDEATIREELAGQFQKVSFPSAQLSSGRYINDSDTIITELARTSGRIPDTLPTYRSYAADVLPMLLALFRENASRRPGQ